ncbi:MULTISPECIES: hypothetical protein [unclassified Psychrobacter]|uniref:hypothetical protein n=1 Tax=unclassified Psychrobacter TaxID=196806 RepID=UPI0020C4C56D|nr:MULTISPECIES: hypothetical protein [unclassified Psychrobacter]
MQNKDMQTKDPQLTKSRIDGTGIDNDDTHASSHDTIANNIADPDDIPKGTETFQETVIGTRYVSDDVDHGKHTHEDIHHNNYNVMSTDDDIENHTTTNKGTDTFQESIVNQERVVNSEHVNTGDNAARQPDRRDQEGSAFDEGINEHTTVSDASKSAAINDLNRYANVDNAQTRVLNPDEKD